MTTGGNNRIMPETKGAMAMVSRPTTRMAPYMVCRSLPLPMISIGAMPV